MKRMISVILTVAAATFCIPSVVCLPPGDRTAGPATARPMPVVGQEKWAAHLRAPADDSVVERLLMDSQFLRPDASPEERRTALNEFKRLWAKRQPSTPHPQKYRELLRVERDAARLGRTPGELRTAMPAEFRTLVVPVEFAGPETFSASVPDGAGGCMDTEITTSGPRHNEIPPPGPRDNFTVWYDDATPELYDELYFGLGPDAGIVVHHPNLGAVDCTAWTIANYYHEQSGGVFVPEGYVYPRWLQSSHSEAWYGAANCLFGSSDRRIASLVREAVDLINADDPVFPWQDFDGDGDGRVDNFTVIHAGMGEESGGGPQGSGAIWSQAGYIDWPDGYLACSSGSPGCADRNIYVREFSIDPENFDVGVGAEEFGHAAFGFPDLYTWDSGTSAGHWALMAQGTWNGPLGGMQPAPLPSWFRYTAGWWAPEEVPYDTSTVDVVVGQYSQPPPGGVCGIKINLPDAVVTRENPLGSGRAWWSGSGDLLNSVLMLTIDLSGLAPPASLSFKSRWDVEEGYDGGSVDISADGGATWLALREGDGRTRDLPVQAGSPGPWLSGTGEDTLRFDLSPFVGRVVLLRLHYVTDGSVHGKGWWAGGFRIRHARGEFPVDPPPEDNDTGTFLEDRWVTVPRTESYPRYYLVEWRNHSGFDEGLRYAYETVWYTGSEWEVDRVPYAVPGALVWFRDASYDFDFYLLDADFETPPSAGPKHGLLVVDSHPFPYAWDDIQYWTGQHVILGGGAQASDAAFALNDTNPFTLRRGFDETWGWVATPPETKTFGPREAVETFDDGVGYYPGLWWDEIGSTARYWDKDASAVLPATAPYSTRITWPDNTPCLEQYGTDLGYTVLGSGKPGIGGVRYGVHMRVMEQAPGGEWGRLRLWNDRSSPPGGMLAADFGTRGLWFFDGLDWSVFLGMGPDIMAVWGNWFLVGYEGYGLYVTDRYNWQQLLPVSPDGMLRWGDRLVLGFESYGLYAFGESGWEYISPVAPDIMAVWKDLLVLGFKTYGIFSYDGREWTYYGPVSPVGMVAWGDLLVLNFADYGVYAYDGTDLTVIHFFSPDQMAVWGDLLVLSYPGYGLYAFTGTDWKLLADSTPDGMVVWGNVLVLDTGTGIATFDGTAPREIISMDPESMLPVYFD